MNKFNNFNNFNNLKLLSNSNIVSNFNIASNSNNHYFILKISGLWETRENIGMTFKIVKINNYL